MQSETYVLIGANEGSSMSDLISRSALIKHLTDWRLQECPVGICDEETETYKTICECIKAVEEQPTAHDVEKVVAELEIKFEQTVAEILDKTGSDFTIADFNVKRYSDRICEIVRKGGAT